MTNTLAFIPAHSGAISSANDSGVFSAMRNLVLLWQTYS